MAGLLVSLTVHTVLLSVLAVLYVSTATERGVVDLFGMWDQPSNELGDIELGAPMPDPGQDAAPLEFPDVSHMVSKEVADFNPGESLRGAVGGKGSGSGSGDGDGTGMALPAVNIPKYAVTKGSFSVWTDPKDPVPGISYEIVIQFRLPANIKKYRGSDLSGIVIGTDKYRQPIQLGNRTFPVEDGSVQVRVRVPGADRLVRDTIRVESKLLREKQEIEIEF